mgnify:CR=1 FL=1
MGCQSASKLIQTSIDKDNLKEIKGRKYEDIKLETSSLKNEKNPSEPRPLYGYFLLEAKCNWKFAIENYCESYHLPWVHPGLNSYSKIEDHHETNCLTHVGGIVFK